jgi:hypothetical protein
MRRLARDRGVMGRHALGLRGRLATGLGLAAVALAVVALAVLSL